VQPDGKSRLKKVVIGGLVSIGFVALILLILLALLKLRILPWRFVDSAVEDSFVAILYIPYMFYFSVEIWVLVLVFVMVPLCMFRKTRHWAGVAFLYTSYFLGATIFVYCCLFVVSVWGYGGLAGGLIFAGVGVVPVALLATLLHAEWSVLLELVVGIVLTFGMRFLGLRLSMIRPTQDEMQDEMLSDYDVQ
jgi:hypothetical protein